MIDGSIEMSEFDGLKYIASFDLKMLNSYVILTFIINSFHLKTTLTSQLKKNNFNDVKCKPV